MSKKIVYEDIQEMVEFVQSKMTIRPTVGIVCGTGLGGINEVINDKEIVKFSDIPNLPQTTVTSHAGQFVLGRLPCGKEVMVQQGRYHFYEGHDQSIIVAPIRMMKLMGVETLILTNAAGGLNQSYSIGDIMVIKDHIYFPGFAGNSPLVGPNDKRFGERFPPIYNLYDRELRKKMLKCAEQLGMDFVRHGIYASVAGPHYETIFDMRFLLKNGCDAVGMSTSGEAICGAHIGLKVVAMSGVSNKFVDSEEVENFVDGDEVTQVVNNGVSYVSKLLERFISEL
uniref:Purine nucleoside phosphorylase n=1 Tax=Dicyema japonicum TaxID=399803 RepID=B9ZYX1_DICJA|nr:nucleoside phosphorylase [Dicyema japonicum]